MEWIFTVCFRILRKHPLRNQTYMLRKVLVSTDNAATQH